MNLVVLQFQNAIHAISLHFQNTSLSALASSPSAVAAVLKLQLYQLLLQLQNFIHPLFIPFQNTIHPFLLAVIKFPLYLDFLLFQNTL
jgi:hypothetical protein